MVGWESGRSRWVSGCVIGGMGGMVWEGGPWECDCAYVCINE